MDPFRPTHIRRAFLTVLKNAGHFPLEDSIVWSHVNSLVPPPPTEDERAATVKGFTDGDYIRNSTGTLDGELKLWVITERGRALLASL